MTYLRRNRENILGIPESVTVRDTVYPVTFDGTYFRTYDVRSKSRSTWTKRWHFRAQNLTTLKSNIEAYEADKDAKREEARQKRSAKKAVESGEVPPVLALFDGELVTVRGWDGRRTGYDRRLLITTGDGEKTAVGPRALVPVSTDKDKYEELVKELKNAHLERESLSHEFVTTVYELNGLDDVQTINYDARLDTFRAFFGDYTTGQHDSIEDATSDLEHRLVSDRYPWCIDSYDPERRVRLTEDAVQGSRYHSSLELFATRDDADRYVTLLERERSLTLQIEETKGGNSFDYDAELAKVIAQKAPES